MLQCRVRLNPRIATVNSLVEAMVAPEGDAYSTLARGVRLRPAMSL
jgi:hypothetical protein